MREKLLKFFIIILILSVVGLGGYVVYDKYFNKEPIPPKTEKKEEKTENLDVTSKEVTSLFNNINKLSHAWTSEDYYGWLFKNDSLKVEDMSDELIVAVSLYNSELDCIDEKGDNTCFQKPTNPNLDSISVISSDKVKANANIIFGSITYDNTSVKSFDCTGNYKYNKENDQYIKEAYGCGYGGSSYNTYEYRITKALKTSSALDMYVKVAPEYYEFGADVDADGNDIDSSMRYIYSDFGKKNEIYKVEEIIYDFNEVLEKHGELLPVYKLHFENENGKYHFKSIEKQ